ncbi:hypothetical protein Dimus_036675, partial [Dionaea muscipula]
MHEAGAGMRKRRSRARGTPAAELVKLIHGGRAPPLYPQTLAREEPVVVSLAHHQGEKMRPNEGKVRRRSDRSKRRAPWIVELPSIPELVHGELTHGRARVEPSEW